MTLSQNNNTALTAFLVCDLQLHNHCSFSSLLLLNPPKASFDANFSILFSAQGAPSDTVASTGSAASRKAEKPPLEGFVRQGVERDLARRLEKSLSLEDVKEKEMAQTVGYNFQQPSKTRLCIHDTAKFKEYNPPAQFVGTLRLSYDQVATFVHARFGSRAAKDRKEAIRNLLFEKLLGMAAVYTDQGNPLCFNRRPSYESKLLQRVNVPARVEALTTNFDSNALTPAVVIFDPADEQYLKDVRRSWKNGDPNTLLRAVEEYEEGSEPDFFTIVGNHSSQAHVKRWQQDNTTQLKRGVFVFFKGQISEDDFRYISRTENMAVQRIATTTAYKGHTEPLNVIPFIREYWLQYKSPPRPEATRKKNMSSKEQDYKDFQTLLHAVLEHPIGDSADLDDQKAAEKQKVKIKGVREKYAKQVQEAQKIENENERKSKIAKVSLFVPLARVASSCSPLNCAVILRRTDGKFVARPVAERV